MAERKYSRREIGDAFEKAYAKRRAHRVTCGEWKKGKPCWKCGMDLNRFFKEIMAELGESP